jgi:uncharacterized cupredoxin-like copper-binding protein
LTHDFAQICVAFIFFSLVLRLIDFYPILTVKDTEMTFLTIKSIAALAMVTTVAGALAAGNHAGGHGEDAIGKPGVAAKVTRTVQLDMTDNMRFNISDLTAKQGETVRFVVKNSGSIKHEMVLGTAQELKDHYEQMKKNPEMEHAEPNMITLAPGKTGEIIWQFTQAGKVDFACLQPGHYDAGMKGLINVARK